MKRVLLDCYHVMADVINRDQNSKLFQYVSVFSEGISMIFRLKSPNWFC